MKRRNYLGVTSTVLFTGCLSSSDEPRSTRTETATQSTSTQTTQEPTPPPETETETPQITPESDSYKWDPDKVHKMVTIGDEDNADDYYEPHSVNIWNVEEATRDFTVTIESRPKKKSQTKTILDETYAVQGDTQLIIRLPEPATYTIEIHVPTDNGEKTITIEQQDYDCNNYDHLTSVYPDGYIEVVISATTLDCNPPPDDS